MTALEFLNPIINDQVQLLVPDILMPLALAFVGFQATLGGALALKHSIQNTADPCGSSVKRKQSECSYQSHEMQFEQVASIVEKSQAHALTAIQLHEAASEKLNAADYALYRLHTDLKAVLPHFAQREDATEVCARQPEQQTIEAATVKTAKAA